MIFYYGGRTFCRSPNCMNECGRKLTKEQEEDARNKGYLICSAYFCGEPKENNAQTMQGLRPSS